MVTNYLTQSAKTKTSSHLMPIVMTCGNARIRMSLGHVHVHGSCVQCGRAENVQRNELMDE